MRVQVFQMFFKTGDGKYGIVPSDDQLYALATKYAEEYIVAPVEFRDYKHTWVACEVDHEGKPERVLGILCMVQRADFPICRFSDNAAVVKLVQRANDCLHDMYNARGTYAFVHIASDERPEDHCPAHDEWMKLFELVPADRWAIKVR